VKLYIIMFVENVNRLAGAAVSFDVYLTCRKFPGGTGLSHYRPIGRFMDGNIAA
jgi:hypothetical protein